MLRLIVIVGIAIGLSASSAASETLAKSKDGTLFIESLPHSVDKEVVAKLLQKAQKSLCPVLLIV